MSGFPVKRVCLSSFTNPHGDRVHQVMVGGQPVTRELADRDAALEIAWSVYDNIATARKEILQWDGDQPALGERALERNDG